MTDIKAILAGRLLAVIQESRERPSDYLVCVCDDYTTKVLSSAMRVHSINDAGVGAVVNIRFPRESLPTTPVMYFLQPTADNWKLLVEDFKKSPKYGYVYLYTTAPVPNDLMGILQGSPIVSRLKAFKELNVDFLAFETKVFSFSRPGTIPALYFRSIPAAVRSEELRRTADQLCSLCVTINEYPYIRYVADNPVTSEIAKLLEKSLENALRNLKNWKFNPNRGTLLILDRSIDCLAPLMHEYTYQAMINDILTVNGDLCRLKPIGKPTNDKQDDSKKKVESDQFVLSEDDSLWKDLRHKHIGEALPTVNQLFTEFREKNAVANLGDDASLKDLVKAAKHAGSFRSEMQRFTKHMSILENVFDHFDKMGLKKLGEIEQDMVTGVTEEGKKTNKTDLMNTLVTVIEDVSISPIDKLRLIMIYIIAQDGIKEQTRKKLFSVAKLNDKHVDAVQNLFHLGVKLQTNRKNSAVLSSAVIKKNAEIAKSSQLSLMRFIPQVYDLMDALVNGQLSKTAYPYLKEPPEAEQHARGAAASARSARSKPASAPRVNKWRNRGGDNGADSSDSSSGSSQKNIFFIAGGMTFSEMRAAYDVAHNTGAEIILGSTSTLTPSQFLDDMMSAHSAAADIEINLDD